VRIRPARTRNEGRAAVQLDGPFGELVLDPSGLVGAASMALDDLGVREDDVHSEAFEGY
jgi:hypothetical protein